MLAARSIFLTASPRSISQRVNPSDVKSRASARTKALPFPRVVPHSDGSGTVDRVGEGDFAANVGADLEALRHEGEVVVYGSGAPEIPVFFLPAILKNVRLRFFIGISHPAAAPARLSDLAVRDFQFS